MRLEQPGEPLPQEEKIFGDDNAHGTSMTTMVGPPGGLLTARMPSNVPSLALQPEQAGSALRISAASPVVGDLDPQQAAGVLHPDLHVSRAGVLDRVGERLGDGEVAGRLDRRIESPGQVDVHLDVYRGVQRQRPDGIAEAAVG